MKGDTRSLDMAHVWIHSGLQDLSRDGDVTILCVGPGVTMTACYCFRVLCFERTSQALLELIRAFFICQHAALWLGPPFLS